MYDILNMALIAGTIMLKNGSETYRVRNIIQQILSAKKIEKENIDILVVGTGIIATIIPDNNKPPITISKSVNKRINNLQKISQVANLAKHFSNKEISITQATKKLKIIDDAIYYNLPVKTIATCLGTAFFSIAFGGSLSDGFFTFLATIPPTFFINYTRKYDFPFFLLNMISGALVAIFIIIFMMNFIWFIPILESPTASYSTTAALAIIGFIYSQYIIIKNKGASVYLKGYFQPLGFMVVFNIIDLFTRPLSLSVRLFGNLFTGGILVGVLYAIMPFLLPLPVHFLELLTGIIQAYVFTLLIGIYASEGLEEE